MMNVRLKRPFSGLLFTLSLLLITGYWFGSVHTQAQTSVTRRINVPYTTKTENDPDGIPVPDRAIFWFGKVGPTDDNYADVRLIYNDEKLHITVHVIDRLLYYKQNPSPAEMTDWDAVTLYLDTDGNVGNAPDSSSYQFVAQVNWNEARDGYQAAYQGDGSGWTAVSIPFETVDGWQGQGFNNTAEDAGWNVTFRIPYTSLGMSGPPPQGTEWGLALILHDNDGGAVIPDKTWPESMSATSPASWGILHFGLPAYTPPVATPGDLVTIKHGVNGQTVIDGHVGGDTTCAGEIPPFWPTWGNNNYAGDPELNVQNQWNLGDWPCFSKYYVTYPLDSLPPGKAIISATLTMYHFGNSLPSEAQPSLIQVFTIADDWNESTLTWNNAPLAVENVSRTWVDPLPAGPPYPNVPITWDVSQAVADAYAAGEPLRLALYSADSARHSGKYFRSSDANESVRPFLTVRLGDLDGFTTAVSPAMQQGSPGTTAVYTLDLQPVGTFNKTLTLSATNPDATNLSVSLSQTSLTPPGQVTITLTDKHAPGFTGSVFYAVPVTITDGTVSEQQTVYLLINGYQNFLPAVQR
ncbi:MAG: DNRLRE domain-containing protein [Chloroflexi bacterium]|nr:MAG: DNRLRE domain-containing protein [Chloroflexota bacterium]